MTVNSILLMLFIISVPAYAQYGTTYIGTEKKSGSMYKWIDHSGKTIYSDTPSPPESCNTASCNEVRDTAERMKWEETRKTKTVYEWRNDAGKTMYSLSAPPLSCTTPSCVSIRGKIAQEASRIREYEATERRKKTHLRKDSIVCLSASNIQSINRGLSTQDYRIEKVLMERRDCFKLSSDIEYTTASEEYRFCECLQVILIGAQGNPSVWVRGYDIRR